MSRREMQMSMRMLMLMHGLVAGQEPTTWE